MKLTVTRIDKLGCPAGKKDVLVFDDEQRGLAVRVTASGGKTFLAQYTFAGGKRRIPLGSCGAVSLADARDAVRAILGRVAQGRDPAAERKAATASAKEKAARDTFTLERLIEDWASLHLSGKRPRYAAEAERALRFAFDRQLSSPAADLIRAAVVKILDELTRRGSAAMAARTAAYGRAAFSWAIKRGALSANPFSNLPLTPTEKRDRVLSDDELAALWRATEGGGTFERIVRTLILTGQRREEVGGMVWEEISDDLTTWTIPSQRTKNGAPHVVPTSQQTLAVIGKKGKGLVFAGRDGGPFNGHSKSKARLDAKMLAELQKITVERGDEEPETVEPWRLHDIRRTAATGLQRLGVRLEVTEAVLNHVSGSRAGIVGIYQRHDWAAEKREALEAWGGHVEKIATAKFELRQETS
ncbi:MAG: DNA recombinase [Methylocystaceae bacterium]|nr:MAG: DNA recombinase [Methylocystaceae bacterium]